MGTKYCCQSYEAMLTLKMLPFHMGFDSNKWIFFAPACTMIHSMCIIWLILADEKWA